MKIEKRERNLLIVAGVLATLVVLRMGLGSSGPEVAEAATESVDMAEQKLAKLRQLAATVPGKESLLKQVNAELANRESGVIQTETAQQAQGQLLQVIRAVGKANDIDARGGEFGPVRPLGADYGEVSVAVSFECGIEQLVNFLAAVTSEKALLATSEIRISSSKPKEKLLNVRLTLSGVIPRKLVPEQKGVSLF